MAARGKRARDFALDLKKFGAQTRQQATIIFRKIIIDLDTAVVLDTPVDTGRAKGNWFPSVNEPSVEVTDAVDPSGGSSITRLTTVGLVAELGTIVWLTNNLPYILPLENGHSQQARDGMVDVNLHRFALKYGGRVVRS